jgi:citrate synthase
LISSTLIDQPTVEEGLMTTLISAAEAARRLAVQPATLYAYVSRGRIVRVRGLDGRSSLFDSDEVDALAGQRRRADPAGASVVPLKIETAITEIGEGTLRFRGHDAVELAEASTTFEQVAELLWTGELRKDVGPWNPPDAVHAAAARAAISVGGSVFNRLTAAMLGAGRLVDGGDTLMTAQLLVSVGPSALRAAPTGPIAKRIAQMWLRPPDKRIIDMVQRVLVLLSDHELATCALAARIAASTRAELSACLAAGLSTLSGPLHGSAASAVHGLLIESEDRDLDDLFRRYRTEREAVPGFGHQVYKSGDLRVAPILALVRNYRSAPDRLAHVEALLSVAATRLPVAPNVDFALGAMSYVCDLPSEAPAVMFSIARLAGMIAHALEEYEAPPLRYRTTARYLGSPRP